MQLLKNFSQKNSEVWKFTFFSIHLLIINCQNRKYLYNKMGV